MARVLVAIVALIVVALGLEPTAGRVTLIVSLGLSAAFVLGWVVLDFLDGEWGVPEQSSVAWGLWLVVMFVVIGVVLLVGAIVRGTRRLVANAWQTGVAVVVAGAWMGVIAAIAGPTVATHVIVAIWLLTFSVPAVGWWLWRLVTMRVTASAWWQRRQRTHGQPELLDRVERLRP